jgi:hypothetical protein
VSTPLELLSRQNDKTFEIAFPEGLGRRQISPFEVSQPVCYGSFLRAHRISLHQPELTGLSLLTEACTSSIGYCITPCEEAQANEARLLSSPLAELNASDILESAAC